MGKMFRSVEMCKLQLIVQSFSLYESIGELGELGIMMFNNLNPGVSAFQQTFVKEIRLAEDMERKIRFFGTQLQQCGMVEDVSELITCESTKNFALPMEHAIQDLDHQLASLETEVRQMNANEIELKKKYIELTELRHIINKAGVTFAENPPQLLDSSQDLASNSDSTLHGASMEDIPMIRRTGDVRVGFVTGVLERDHFPAFERVMWRACRGNVLLRHVEIKEDDKDTMLDKEVHKVVVIAFFHGHVLETKVKRICDGFGATLYPCPEKESERNALLARVNQSISELKMVLSRTIQFKLNMLQDIMKQYEGWVVKVKKIKAVYHVMNMFNYDVTNAALIGEGWCPVDRLDQLRNALIMITTRSGAGAPTIIKRIKTNEMPPTLQYTNKFTEAFQTIVDAYGVATYQEVNPGLFTLISFPFIFAVMFGDVGHGALMALGAIWMLLNEKRLIKTAPRYGEIFLTIFQGRYIILLMGLFSIYTGAIYNDFFSKMVWAFESRWALPQNIPYTGSITLNPSEIITTPDGPCKLGCGFKNIGPYPFGIDPVWGLSDNKLNYLNSFKMKSSILIGFIHMSFGICLQVFNHLHFKKAYSVYMEFLPQMLFFGSIFGYLSILIIAKWTTVWSGECSLPGEEITHSCDPSILILLINMFLSPGTVTYADHTIFFSNYKAQSWVQLVLIMIAVVCVPWMLLMKPFYLKRKAKQGAYAPVSNFSGSVESDEELVRDEEEGCRHEHDDTEKFDFGEIMVHQAIHTIEFTLNCVSNTASYLRLWALSLAHAQLSEVLWDMVLRPGFGSSIPGVMLFVTFGAWSTLTICVLLLMEGMSAFLHALRLHWVEFNGKFYMGLGYQFEAYDFSKYMMERPL